MKRLIIILLAFYFVSAAAFAESAPSSAAIQLAQRQAPKMLLSLSRKVIHATQSYQMMVAEYGISKTEKNIDKAIESNMPKHLPKWEGEFAKAYSDNLSEDDMQAILKQTRNPDVYTRYNKAKKTIGSQIRKNGEGIFQKFSSEVLSEAFITIQK